MEQQGERIVVETPRLRVTGFLHMPREGYRSRLTDYLNSDRSFVALTDAVVEHLDGHGEAEHKPFVALSLAHVVLAAPVGPTG